MSARMKIDFVSDVSCPWCAIGLHALEAALAKLAGEVQAELHFQPFELNPQMGPAGEEIIEHLSRKYGVPPAQMERSQDTIRSRGAELGFTFDLVKRTHIYNTFDAHRLLHWVGLEDADKQQALKHALLKAYFTEGRDPSNHDVLVDVATRVGLDPARARQILASDEYAADVRARERFYQEQGIHAVPAVVINDRHLIEGGQPVEVFERVLRQLATRAA